VPEPARYSEPFAAVLAESRGPASNPTKTRTARALARHGLSSDDVRHLPALMAAGLAFLLLVGSGTASWYAIVGALPRDSQMTQGTSVAASDAHDAAPVALPAALTESDAAVPAGARPAIGASPVPDEWSWREVWLPAALDPAPLKLVPVGIETAATPVGPPPEMPDLVAMAAEPGAVPAALADPAEVPVDQAAEPGAGAPAITGSGDGKGPSGSSFFDPYPQSALPSVRTASRVGTGGAAGNDTAPSGTVAAGDSDQTNNHTKKGDSGHRAPGSMDKQDGKGARGNHGPDAKNDKGRGHGHRNKDKDNGGKGHGGKDNGGRGNGKGAD
jgi:hypothetical protein